jgi:hypothetical protein
MTSDPLTVAYGRTLIARLADVVDALLERTMHGVRHNFDNFSTDIRTEVVKVVSDPNFSDRSPRYSSGPTVESLPRSRYMRSTVALSSAKSISTLFAPATYAARSHATLMKPPVSSNFSASSS